MYIEKDIKILLVVPNVQLVKQMKEIFKEYSENYDPLFVDKFVHCIYSGKSKITDKQITISTWQSLQKEQINYFKKYGIVLIDEVHKAQAEKLTEIIHKCINCDYKFGLTGYLPKTNHTLHMQLKGLFSKLKTFTIAKDLIDKNILSKFEIKSIILEYPKELKEEMKEAIIDFKTEIDIINEQELRRQFIYNLASSIKNNTLILFKHRENGLNIYNKLKQIKNKKILYVDGLIKVDKRELIRNETEKNDNIIIVASYGTFSEGIDIKNLYNLIMAESVLSPIKVIQSIGRMLRLYKNKKAILYDIVDDLRTVYNYKVISKANYTLKHFYKRCNYYKEEQHKNEIKKFKLEKLIK